MNIDCSNCFLAHVDRPITSPLFRIDCVSIPRPPPRCMSTGDRQDNADDRIMASRPTARAGQDHAPTNPSGLRQTYTASSSYGSAGTRSARTSQGSDGASDHGPSAGPSRPRPTEITALLDATLDFREQAHEGPCNHGAFSPRPTSPSSSILGGDSPSASESEAEVPGIDGVLAAPSPRKRKSWKRRWASKIKSKKMSTSSALAQQHGVRDSALM